LDGWRAGRCHSFFDKAFIKSPEIHGNGGVPIDVLPGSSFIFGKVDAVFIRFNLCMLHDTDQVGISIGGADTSCNGAVFRNGIF